LPLSFQNIAATSVRLLKVEVSNYGKTLIGKEDHSLWRIAFEAPFSTHIAAIGDPQVNPKGVVAHVVPEAHPNLLGLELGTFEPRASIGLHLMLLNTNEASIPRIKIHPSLEGLPHELILQSPADLIADKILWQVLLAFWLVIIAWLGPRWYKEYKSGDLRLLPPSWKPSVLSIALLLLAILSAVGVTTLVVGVVVQGIAYVVTWFL
jgi:hypothetical protein